MGDNVKDVTGIYKIENLQNGKCYIGQSRRIGERWRQHMSGNSGSPYLANAIKLYGVECFSFTILVTLPDDSPQAYLDDLEKKYIADYDTVATGYNIRSGGQGERPTPRHVWALQYQPYYDKDLHKWVTEYDFTSNLEEFCRNSRYTARLLQLVRAGKRRRHFDIVKVVKLVEEV